MRILIAHSFYRQPGGEDRYVSQQVELLSGDHEVELLARRNDQLPGGLGTATRMTYSRKDVAEVYDAITAFAPDVIHVHNVYPAFGPAVHLAAKRAGVPLVMTVHNFRLRCPNGYMFTEGQICRRCEGGNYANGMIHRCFPQRTQAAAYTTSLWVHRFILRFEKTVAMFIAPSQFMENTLLDWGIPRERVTMIRNFTEIPEEVSTEPGEYGMYLGRLSSEKGVDVLLEALKLARDPPFKIVGDGPLKEPLMKRAIGLSKTQFLGRQPHNIVSELLRASRFVAICSLSRENAPLAALEALAHAKPLLITATGGLPELVSARSGTSVPASDAEALSAAVSVLMQDDSLCHRSAAAARQYALEHLSSEMHYGGLQACYQNVVGD